MYYSEDVALCKSVPRHEPYLLKVLNPLTIVLLLRCELHQGLLVNRRCDVDITGYINYYSITI
jgi:hypothetical protein